MAGLTATIIVMNVFQVGSTSDMRLSVVIVASCRPWPRVGSPSGRYLSIAHSPTIKAERDSLKMQGFPAHCRRRNRPCCTLCRPSWGRSLCMRTPAASSRRYGSLRTKLSFSHSIPGALASMRSVAAHGYWASR